MSSKRRVRRRSCTGKQQFATHQAALAALMGLHRAKGYQGYMQPYRCPFCGQYHYGHPPARPKPWMRRK